MKSFILWNYERGSWQYDVFCLLIVAFIFLTPKAWFEKRERLATQTTRIIVKAEDIPLDAVRMNERIKELSGNPNAEITDFHETHDALGNKFYEIDIK